MFRKILWQNFLISIIMFQFLSCDDGQDGQQLNQNYQQGDQNGDSTNKRDPRYYCDDGFEIFCPLKKVRLLLHKIKKAVTPSPSFHLPKFEWHNPFSGDSGDDKNKDNSQNCDSPKFDPPKYDPPQYNPPQFQPQNPFTDHSGGNNNNQQ